MNTFEEKLKFEVVLGTYEEYVLGYKFLKTNLEQSFATHSHTSSVRCAAISDAFLATGGADDRIVIYDLRSRKEHGILTHHNSTVTCLKFTPDGSHLISGSADGVIAVVRTGNWQLEKLWNKSHKGKVIIDIAVHPSGKLLISLGADASLQTWNLIKGRQAYIINLNNKSGDPKSLEQVQWAPCGVKFALVGGKYSEVWSIEKGGILQTIQHESKVTRCCWLSEEVLLVGCENGNLIKVNVTNGNTETIDGSHNNRIKGLEKFGKYIITTCSGGDIIIWNKKFKECAKINTGCRNICMCVVPIIIKKDEEKIEPEVVIVKSSDKHKSKRLKTNV